MVILSDLFRPVSEDTAGVVETLEGAEDVAVLAVVYIVLNRKVILVVTMETKSVVLPIVEVADNVDVLVDTVTLDTTDEYCMLSRTVPFTIQYPRPASRHSSLPDPQQ